MAERKFARFNYSGSKGCVNNTVTHVVFWQKEFPVAGPWILSLFLMYHGLFFAFF